MCRAHGYRAERRNGRSTESAPFTGRGLMDSCMVGHKRGSRQLPGFRILCFGSFQQQLGAHQAERLVLGSLLERSTQCARACVRAGLAAAGFTPRRDVCPASTSKQMLRAASRCPDQPYARREPRSHRLQPHGFHCYGWMLSVVPIAILANVLQVIWRKASRQKIFWKMLGGSH